MMNEFSKALLEVVQEAPAHAPTPADQLVVSIQQLEVLCRDCGVLYLDAIACCNRLGVWVLE